MMEKLVIDTLVLNAKEYKIDGFRFDIMSFMFTYNMANIQAALSALTLKIAVWMDRRSTSMERDSTSEIRQQPDWSKCLAGESVRIRNWNFQRPHSRRHSRWQSLYG